MEKGGGRRIDCQVERIPPLAPRVAVAAAVAGVVVVCGSRYWNFFSSLSLSGNIWLLPHAFTVHARSVIRGEMSVCA